MTDTIDYIVRLRKPPTIKPHLLKMIHLIFILLKDYLEQSHLLPFHDIFKPGILKVRHIT